MLEWKIIKTLRNSNRKIGKLINKIIINVETTTLDKNWGRHLNIIETKLQWWYGLLHFHYYVAQYFYFSVENFHPTQYKIVQLRI